jgi:hypothetical protein
MGCWEACGLKTAGSERMVVQRRICDCLHLLDYRRLEADVVVGGSSCC